MKNTFTISNSAKCFLLLWSVCLLNIGKTHSAIANQAGKPSAVNPWETGAVQKEIPNLRTRNAKHFRLADGKMVAYYGSGSIHYKQGNQWLEIDNQIKIADKGLSYAFYNEANSFKTYYPVNPFKNFIVTDYNGSIYKEKITGIYFLDASGVKIGNLAVLENFKGKALGNKIVFENIAKGIDLVYTQNNDGRKMDLILKSAEALLTVPQKAVSFSIEEELVLPSGVSLNKNVSGLELYKGSQLEASIAQPLAFEPATEGTEQVPNPGMITAVQNGRQQFNINTSFDMSWLRNANRKFPVSLDPSINYGPFAVSMATGYMTTATGAKTNGLLRIAGANTFAWGKFNTAGFPALGATSVDSVFYFGYHYSTTNATDKIAKVVDLDSLDVVSALNTAIVASINAKTNISPNYVYASTAYNWHSAKLDASYNSLFNSYSVARGWTAIGFTYLSGATTFAYHYGWNATGVGIPLINYIQVYYTLPPCTNPVSGGTTTGPATVCAGTIGTYALSGASIGSGMTYQWQSSPDGSTWSNVTGAVFENYNPVITQDSIFFRCQLICNLGTPAYSTSKKVYADVFKVTPLTPYNESFESITVNNTLPACMSATNLGTTTLTYITAPGGTYNQIPRTGSKFASFRYGCNDFFFTKGLKLDSGVTYSFSTWYITDGYASSWDSLSLYLATAPNASSVTLIPGGTVTFSSNTTYMQLVGSYTVTRTGVYQLGIKVLDPGNPWYLSIDDINVQVAGPPTVTTGTKSLITTAGATLAGNVAANGGSAITASGVVVSTSANPVRGGFGVTDSATSPTVGAGIFSKPVGGLTLSTLYHYRAYAVNAIGTSYGADSTFTTLGAAVAASIVRIPATTITGFGATLGGNITSDGGSTVFISGVVVGTSPNPAKGGLGVIDSITNPPVGFGSFTFGFGGLNPGTKYYFRAYAQNGVALTYSVQDSFNTNPVISFFPYMQNFDTLNLNTGWNSAPVVGTLNDWIMGTPAKTTLTAAFTTPNAWITKLAANYSTSHDAALMSPQFNFSSLTANPLLRFKHKFYTESCCDGGFLEISINGGTWTKVENTVGTGTNYNTTNAIAWYNLTTQGNSWGDLSSTYSTASNGWITSMIALPGAAGQSNVRIRFRFITDTSVEYDGWEIDNVEVFSPAAPTLLTGAKTNITTSSVTLAGNITNDGGSAVTASGVVVGTSLNPVRGGTGVIDSTTSPVVTVGTFTKNVAGLATSTLYHYRAYAVNAIGTSYGADSTFTTNASAVIPTVLRIAASNVGSYTATVGGNITSDGGSSVFLSGVVYSTTNNPLIAGLGVTDSVTFPTVTLGNYSFNLAGLSHSTKYYFRAYALNSVGVSYSTLDSFSTNPVISYLPYAQNFDTTGLNTGWTTAIVSGTLNNWVLGTPAKTYLTNAYSGTKAWNTKLSGNYDDNHDAAVVSPQFDFTSVSATPLLRFKHKFVTEAGWDALIVEISINGGLTWTKLDNTLGTGGNYNTTNSTGWYNSSSTSGPIAPSKFSSLASGTGSNLLYSTQVNGWFTSITPLTGATGQSNVKFRFRFGSDASGTYEGWSLDDIEVFIPSAPVVATGVKTNLTTSTVTLAGNITSNGGSPVTMSGVVVGFAPNPVKGGSGVIDSLTSPLVSNGPFTVNIDGLFSATSYYYRAYATNAIGTTYGPDSVFTTNAAAVPPTIVTVAASNISTTTARVSANITSNGGSAVFLSGIVISTVKNPVRFGTGVIDSTTFPTISNGTFAFNLAGLTSNTKYYYRGYATNVAGIAYSLNDSFTTDPIISALPYTQNFESGTAGWASQLTSTNTSVNWILGFATYNNWVLGTPAKTYLSGAHSGTKAWVTGLTGTYDIDHDASVVSPQFNFTAYANDPVVRFYHKFKAETDWDGLIVEISVNGGYWRRLDSIVGTGTNYNTTASYSWYNDNVNYVSSGGILAPPYFSNDIGSGSVYSSQVSGWIESAFKLTGAAGQSNVRFRFRFISDTYVIDEGWAIDDIEVVNIVTPTTPATAVTTSSPNGSTVNVSWTNGNGNGRLVVARLNTTTAVAPTNNTLYGASSVFGSTNTTGTGNYIVYNGTGNSAVVTGLTASTLYAFDVYEFNGKYMHDLFTLAASGTRTTLPVEFISFTGSVIEKDVMLNWITAQELNNKGFNVERSVDGIDFSEIAFVKGKGNSHISNSYSISDANAFEKLSSEKLYYRLAQVDFDGTVTYSNIVAVDRNVQIVDEVKVFPNPFLTAVGVNIESGNNTQAIVEMVDMQGRIISSETVSLKQGGNYHQIQSSRQLSNGIYFVNIKMNGDNKTVKVCKMY